MIALFFDTETTGFRSETFTPEIVQIGAILQDTADLRVLGEINLIIKPKNPIPEYASAVHSITDEYAEVFGLDNNQVEQVFMDLAARADILVAHNIAFDLNIIDGVWRFAHSIMRNKEQYCTMVNGTGVATDLPEGHRGQPKRPKLVEIYRHFFHEDFPNAHDAMADVRACRDVYFALTKEHYDRNQTYNPQ